MNSTDSHLFWAEMQMNESQTPMGVRVVVEKLLETFVSGVSGVAHSEEVLATFDKLARAQSLAPSLLENGGRWEDARPGNIVVRDIMRVKHDAYPGKAGIAHNGRVGAVVAVRHGDIHLRYTDDREPKPQSVAHSPYVLEKHFK